MDTISAFMDFMLQTFLWYLFFNFVINLLLYSKRKQAQENTAEIHKKLEEYVHVVSVEQHGNMYYWFDADDGRFLGQGAETAEIIEHVKRRFPTHFFLLPTQELIHAPDWKPKPLADKTVD
jgi:hypothetical protein